MSLEGQQIDRYRIMRLLGSGGMGEVYLAEDARIAQQVAIKVIRTEVTPYPDANSAKEAARLFEREAKAIARLDHPNILPLYAYGEETVHGQQLTYLVMPYRKEGTLASWLRQRGTTEWLSAADVAHLVTQAAEALQHAHDQQILHQDIKPSNFLIRTRKDQPSRPDLLLADFGIAKFTTATASASQSIRGTPTYMAPEQWDGQPVAATDQYALAIMAYELLTGRPPFSGNLGQIMRQHFQAVPQPPSALNPALSPALDAVLLRALAKEPQARFPSVSDFAQAFQQAALAPLAATLPSPSPSPSTVLKETPPIAQSGKDLRSTLAISQKEAMSGTSRMLTLPNGRRVLVTVPARASDGQVIRLEGFGEPSRTGGPAGSLVLTLLVKAAEEAPPLAPASATGAEETVLTATPEAAAPSAPTVRTTAQQATASPPARPERSTPPSLESSPTEVATPASQGSFSLTELALPSKPSMGRPAERSQVNQAEQQTDVVPADRPSRSPERFTAQSAQRGLSRRTVLVGLGLTGLAVAGGGITWWVLTPHLGTTLYTYHGHSGSVDAVAWSPDGRRIALGSYDKTVQVWVAAV
jgi:serine/threonine protein kinase